jgi:S-formylglutathione hydrolase FrmB
MEFWWLVTFWVDGVGLGQAPPALLGRHQLARVSRNLSGQLIDFTNNHGADRRIWSSALHQKRSLYVYLPPGFDPNKRYPLAIFLHGAAQDEQFFLQAQVEAFDKAMARGGMPPTIIAAPDGSIRGRATLVEPASFWANSKAGAFEDYLMCDVWNFLMQTFPIRPEREAHALIGASMGGSAAFTHAIKHKDRIKTALAFMPLLNLRYVDCQGRYRTDFDPECFGFRDKMRGFEALGRRRFFVLRFADLFVPMFGRGSQALAGISAINPLEVMERYNLQPGELNLFVGYGGKDEFNIAAQVESFLHAARQRGVEVAVEYDPNGRHDLASGHRLMAGAVKWAADRVPKAP